MPKASLKAIRQRTIELRAPDAGLDAQQRVAYTRLADKPDLATSLARTLTERRRRFSMP